MDFKKFLTPAYLTALVLVLLGAVLITVGQGILGWLVLLVGLALSVAANSASHNREQWRQMEQKVEERAHHQHRD